MAKSPDQLIRFLLPEAKARGAFIRGTNLINEGIRVHGLAGEPGKLFGQTLLASILLLSISKGGVRQVLQIDAKDPIVPMRRILAEARPGAVRGYVTWHEDEPSVRPPGGHGVSTWLGKPIRLSTVRDLGFGQPYISTIEHDSDFIADHILHYLNQSVQIQADITIDDNTGLMLEAMPGCDDDAWFSAIRAMAKISREELLKSPPEKVLAHFDSLGCKILGHDDYAYTCGCNAKAMAESLKQIPREQLEDLVNDNGKILIACQYCESSYELDLD